MFNLPEFERASQDRFFLCIERMILTLMRPAPRSFLEASGPCWCKR